jgi:pimeloyl-ACP methyl ester carboxylesterase
MAVVMAAWLAATSVSCGGEGSTRVAPTTLPAPEDTGADVTGLVEVSDRNLHLECTGTGSPTVILQSGFGNAGDIWSFAEAEPPAVQPGLAASSRVCSYDRPGSMITTTTAANGAVTLADALTPGRSEPAPMPRDPAEVVTELHDLLAAADVPGPYVLVGHSLGGALNVLYARTYPDEVSGLVIVDSPLPPLRGLATPQQWEKLAILAIPPDAIPGYELESYDVGTLFDEIEAASPLADIPVIVITRGEIRMNEDPIPDGLTAAEVEAINETQREAQAAFAASVPGAQQITVPGTTHYVQTQRPDAVIEAIRDLIGRI